MHRTRRTNLAFATLHALSATLAYYYLKLAALDHQLVHAKNAPLQSDDSLPTAALYESMPTAGDKTHSAVSPTALACRLRNIPIYKISFIIKYTTC